MGICCVREAVGGLNDPTFAHFARLVAFSVTPFSPDSLACL